MTEWVAKYWLQVLFGAFVSMATFVTKKKIKELDIKIKEQEAIKSGVQALLRDRIIQAYNYCWDQGYCPIHMRDNVHNLHEQYHLLGGNGTVKDLVKKIENLPVEEGEII